MKPIYLKPDQSVVFVAPKDPKINGWGDKMYIENPPYRPGEECYVREALHKGINMSSSEYCSIHYPDDTPVLFKDGAFMGMFGKAIWQWGGLRLPIIAMPQWASRRHVRIVSCEPIRVEDVTEEDAKRMGVEQLLEPGTWKDYGDPDSICLGATGSFLSLWHKKHPGKQWAWRVEVKEVRA
jgi:hypothetical protein